MTCPYCGSHNIKARNSEYKRIEKWVHSVGEKNCPDCGRKVSFRKNARAVAMLWSAGGARGAGSARGAGK